MLAIIAKPYDPAAEITLTGPPHPFGVATFGPEPEWSILGREVRVFLAEETYIGEPGDIVPGDAFPLDITIAAPPVPFGVAPFGPALEYSASLPASLAPPSEDASNIYFEPRLKQSLNFSVRLWEGDEPEGRSRPGVGAIEIANGDGWFDDYMALGWDGRPLRVYEGLKSQAFADWQLRAVLTAEQLEWTQGIATLFIKDPQSRLAVALQQTLYLGTGGVEGGDDIKGRPKPVALGFCENVPAVLVDSVNLVYQAHYREIESVAAVRDKGIALTPASDRATYAALIAASIAPGAYDTCLAEGLFRLGSSPDGRVTADVEGDAPGGDYVNTTGGLARRIAVQMLPASLRFSDPDEIASAAFALLDAVQPAEIGFFTAEPVAAADVLDRLMMAIGGVWGVTLLGQLTVSRLEAPGGVAMGTLSAAEFADIRRQGPVPSWRRRIGYRPMWATQSGDELAAAVSDANKAIYSAPFRYAVAETETARVTHRRARDVTIDGFFADEADAADEAARQQEMFGLLRSIYTLRCDRGPFSHELGEVLALANLGRFGVDDDAPFRLIGLTADRARGEVLYELWG